MQFQGQIGLHFTPHIANHYTTKDLVSLAEDAHRLGFDQVWVNDNLRYRNVFVILAAIATKVPIKLGTSIMVPYYRNPVDVADSVAAITELSGAQVDLGLAKGSPAQTGSQVRVVKPMTMVAETGQCVKRLLAGETVRQGDYPLLASYFNMQPETSIELAFQPKAPTLVYGGTHGPKGCEMSGRHLDGLMLGTRFLPLLRTGKMEERIEIAEKAATQSHPGKKVLKTGEITISISTDLKAARDYIRPFVAHHGSVLPQFGFTDADFAKLGIKPAWIEDLKQAFQKGATIEEAAKRVPDAMVDALCIAGDIKSCRERIVENFQTIAKLGFDQIILAKLGPDYRQAMHLLAEHVLPSV